MYSNKGPNKGFFIKGIFGTSFTLILGHFFINKGKVRKNKNLFHFLINKDKIGIINANQNKTQIRTK